MLVGEHGRVIPFRHFREIALAVTAIALFSTLALCVLGLLFYYQSRSVERLRNEVGRLQHQTKLLKDEKDVLKARLVIRSLQANPVAETQASQPEKAKSAGSAPDPPVESHPETDPKEPQQKQPGVHWRADIRQFAVTYDANRESFKARFRIYNTSVPKKPLSGRIVVAFKSDGDPPVEWTTVPNVLFEDGKPSGQRGHAFSIRNYRTMEFRAGGQKMPDAFNAATVYVFSDEGKLLLSRDFGVNLSSEKAAPKETVSSAAGKPAKSEEQTATDASSESSAALPEKAADSVERVNKPDGTELPAVEQSLHMPQKTEPVQETDAHAKPEGERP